MRESAKRKASQPKAGRERTVARDAGWVSLYVNSTDIRSSPWDFDFRLGVIDEATPESLQIRELARVHMSPTHAKALLRLLELHIQVYEQRNSPIPDVDFGLEESREKLLKAEPSAKTH